MESYITEFHYIACLIVKTSFCAQFQEDPILPSNILISMVTVHRLGIVRYRCIFKGFVTFTKDTSVEDLVTIGPCVRPQSCPEIN